MHSSSSFSLSASRAAAAGSRGAREVDGKMLARHLSVSRAQIERGKAEVLREGDIFSGHSVGP